MAGVIKSKGNQVFTAQVRSINTDTGSGYVTEALQRANARISDSLYRQAVDQQQRAGQEFARTQLVTSIKDAEGRTQFVDAFDDLSVVAQDAARPLIERKYAAAFNRDVEAVLLEQRAASKNSTEFEMTATVALQGLLDAVPPDFEFVAKDALENSGSLSLLQHKQSMVLTEKRIERQAFIESERLRFRDGSTQIAGLASLGDGKSITSAVALRKGLEDELKRGMQEGIYTAGFVSDQKNNMDRDFYGSLLKSDLDALLQAGNTEEAFEMIRALELGSSYKFDDPRSPLADFDTFAIRADATRRAIAGDLKEYMNMYSNILKQQAQQKVVADLVANLSTGNNTSGDKKLKNAFGSYWESIGVTQDRRGWLSDNAVALVQNPEGVPHKAIVNGNILPTALQDLLNGIADGTNRDLSEKELQNAVTIFQTVTQGIGRSGDIPTDKGLSDEAVMFFNNMDTWINTFGIDSILQGGGIYAGSAGSDRAKAIQDGVVSKLGGRNARQSIIDHMREKKLVKGLPAGAVDRLMVIAQPAYAFLSTSEADGMLESAIDAIYAETDLIKMPDNIGSRAEITRSEFAPERFYPDDQSLGAFADFVDKRVTSVTGNTGVLGTDYFLYPSSQSTNRQIRWFVVDAEGQYLPNSEGRPLVINSSNVNRAASMQSAFDAALDKKLDEARALRTLAMTGIEPETAENLEEIVKGFNEGVLADE